MHRHATAAARRAPRPSALIRPSARRTRAGAGLLPDAAKLAGKRVAVEQGTVQESYARTKWAPAGVDGVLMDAGQGQIGFLDTPRGNGFAFAGGVVYDPQIMGDGDAAGVRKSDPDLRAALNGAIAQILRDGAYRKIEAKYFTFDMYSS